QASEPGLFDHDMKALVKCSAAVASLGAATLCLFLSPTASSADSGLIASDGGEYQAFGEAVFIRGSFGFVGAPFADGHGPGTGTGLAYLFRDLETDSGPMTETVKLVAGSRENAISVSLWGNMGIVGARSGWGEGGAAYVYHDLDTVAGSSNQNVDNSVAPSAKLTPLDGHLQDQFGESVSLWGTAGLVGAPYAVSPTGGEGAAYLFRNLDTATGTITESVRLAASDGGNQFGQAGSLAGNLGLVGAYTDSEQTGAAYVFRHLETASGTVTEDVRLTASDRANYDWFGYAVSVDGNIGLVGAHNADSGSREDSGAAYVFRGLDVAAGTVTEAVKLTASRSEERRVGKGERRGRR